MESKKPFGGISGSTLKLFAIITMLIDHTGATIIQAILHRPDLAADPALRSTWQSLYNLSRSIGRLAFPVFCFLLVEGFIHTRNVYKYAGRLFLFALISEIPFDLALKSGWYDPSKQNVYFTLLLGLLVLIGISWCEKICEGNTIKRILCLLLSFAVLWIGMELANRMDTDYNFKGVFLIAILYLSRSSRLVQCMAGAAGVSWELPAPLGFIPVYLYNGKRGLRMKYFFYWFYPVHLLLLHVLEVYAVPVLPLV